jgi:hypothetical protein
MQLLFEETNADVNLPTDRGIETLEVMDARATEGVGACSFVASWARGRIKTLK